MEHTASILRAVVDALDLPGIQEIARLPGIRAVYRLTVRYHDGRARASVATLTRRGADDMRLEVVYQGLFHHKPLVFTPTPAAYEAFTSALHQTGFDNLTDQSSQAGPSYGHDLWLLERAAGSFTKSIIFAPDLVEDGDPHAQLIAAVAAHLPEAMRAVPV